MGIGKSILSVSFFKITRSSLQGLYIASTSVPTYFANLPHTYDALCVNNIHSGIELIGGAERAVFDWQEYIRRQLEEEQRHLEILQQQLLHEQAMLLVSVWPSKIRDISFTFAFFCCCFFLCPPLKVQCVKKKIK